MCSRASAPPGVSVDVLVDILSVPLWVVAKAEGRVVWVNAAAAAQAGVGHAALIGLKLTSTHSNVEALTQVWQGLAAGREAVPVTLELPGEIGGRICGRADRINLSDDTPGLCIEGARAVPDVAVLRAHRLARLGTWESGPQGFRASPSLAELLVCPPGAFDGTLDGFLAFVHPEDRQKVTDGLAATAAGGGVMGLDHRMVLTDGRVRHVHQLAALDRPGPPPCLSGIVQDITDRKVLEELLRNALGLQQAIFDHVQEGIVFLRHRIISQANARFWEIIGYPADSRIGQASRFLYADEATFTRVGRCARAAFDRGEIYQEDVQIRRGDGRLIWARIKGARLGVCGGPGASIWVLRDISRHKEMSAALRASEARYRYLFQHNRAIELLIDPETGAIVDANKAAQAFYGYDLEAFTRLSINDINVLPADALAAEMARAKQEQRDHFYFRHRLKSGEIRDVEVRSGPIDYQGKTLLYSIVHDITARRVAERALRESEEKFRRLVEESNVISWEADFADFRFTYVSPQAERILGYPVDAWYEDGFWPAHIHPDDRERSLAYCREAGQRGEDHRFEYRMVAANGVVVWLHDIVTVITDGQGRPRRLRGMMFDVTERKHAEDIIRYQALHDGLTDLPNRTLFFDRLRHALRGQPRRRGVTALLFVDLDGFKAVNDDHGHEIGDQVLVAVAERLRDTVRAADTVARLGGDEFIVLLADLDSPQLAGAVAEKLRIALARPLPGVPEAVHLSASIGIAVSPRDGTDPDQLVSRADTAMYRAKHAGRNCYRFFGPGEPVPCRPS